VRISELSETSGVPLPTVKYYLREGLLPAGERTARNQADYGPEHLARLRLIRALLEVGGLSIADVRNVLAASDSPELPLDEIIGAAHAAVTSRNVPARVDPDWAKARDTVLELAEKRGWLVVQDTPALDQAADALAAISTMHVPVIEPLLEVYAEHAQQIAEQEVAAVLSMDSPEEIMRGVVVGTIVGQSLLNALRLLAQQSVTGKLLGRDERECPDPS
jgi:DNA-binding transcriptional MerR regulator